jgi:hypothetical protein
MKTKEIITRFDSSGDYTALAVGDTVQAKAFGFWYDAKIVSFGSKLIKIEYTSGTGVTRQKSVSFSIDKPEAATLRLHPKPYKQ